MNGLRFVFLTQKEPVHKSHLLMKPTTLGALRARATIVQFSERLVFLPLFSVTLSSPLVLFLAACFNFSFSLVFV